MLVGTRQPDGVPNVDSKRTGITGRASRGGGDYGTLCPERDFTRATSVALIEPFTATS